MYISDTYLLIYVSVLIFYLGCIFGSFINCTASRICNNENWISGRSHCEHCNHELGVLDLIPIFSYIFLGGKCRYCKKHITVRYLLIELLMGFIFLITFLSRRMLDLKLVQYLILFVLLMGLSLVDLETYIIPDGFIILGIINFLLGLFGNDVKSYLIEGLSGGLIIGGTLLIISLIMDKVLNKESMGGGDIKLLFMVCLYTGVFKGLFLLFVSCVIGLVFVVLLKQRKIAFGPSISIAAFFILIWGDKLLEIYLSLFQL